MLTLRDALLQKTLFIASHVGRSSMFWSTSSSNSKLVNWPSPFSVLRLILSGDRFLVNLKQNMYESLINVRESIQSYLGYTWELIIQQSNDLKKNMLLE